MKSHIIRSVTGEVTEILTEREGAQEISVRIDEPVLKHDSQSDSSELRTAINLTSLTGPVSIADRVVLNTVAVEMELGTGGLDFVIHVDRPQQPETPPGHILKLRYTPLQLPVLAVEAQESPHHAAIRKFRSLEDTPVVCAELHSQVPAVCAAARWGLKECDWPSEPRIAYIMTDGASLPIALSRLVPQMRASNLIQATITSGQAFGGDYEAVNLYSALAAARQVVKADLIVVSQGPGNVGTDTPLGFSGIEQGEAINAVAALGGTPILLPRLSFHETRKRHQGLSHHTLTILQRITLSPALLPLPRLPKKEMQKIRRTLERTELTQEHQPIVISADQAYESFLNLGLDVTTMGKTPIEARPFFLAATAAGLLAAQMVEALAV